MRRKHRWQTLLVVEAVESRLWLGYEKPGQILFQKNGVVDANNPGTAHSIDLTTEAATVAIVKAGSEAFLYVNDQLAFQLTADTSAPGGNRVAFGQFTYSGQGKAIFDNVAIAPSTS